MTRFQYYGNYYLVKLAMMNMNKLNRVFFLFLLIYRSLLLLLLPQLETNLFGRT